MPLSNVLSLVDLLLDTNNFIDYWLEYFFDLQMLVSKCCFPCVAWREHLSRIIVVHYLLSVKIFPSLAIASKLGVEISLPKEPMSE